MTEQSIAEVAAGLTRAQRDAIVPGPGNPEYARGPAGSMKKLEALGVFTNINAFSSNGKRGARLTPFGRDLRNHLISQGADQ